MAWFTVPHTSDDSTGMLLNESRRTAIETICAATGLSRDEVEAL